MIEPQLLLELLVRLLANPTRLDGGGEPLEADVGRKIGPSAPPSAPHSCGRRVRSDLPRTRDTCAGELCDQAAPGTAPAIAPDLRFPSSRRLASKSRADSPKTSLMKC